MTIKTIWIAALVFILAGLSLIIVPYFSDVPQERLLVGAMAPCMIEGKMLVERKMLAGEQLPDSIDNHCAESIDRIAIDPKGIITVENVEFGVTIELIPALTEGSNIQWRCQGSPKRHLPENCRK